MAIKLRCVADTHGRLPPALDERGAAAWLRAGDVYEAPGPDGVAVEPRSPIDTTVNGVKLRGYRLDDFDFKDDAEVCATTARKNGYLLVKVMDTQPAAK
jgi:hypothetical protein